MDEDTRRHEMIRMIEAERTAVVAFIERTLTVRTTTLSIGATVGATLVGWTIAQGAWVGSAAAVAVLAVLAVFDLRNRVLIRSLMAQERTLEGALNAYFKALVRPHASEMNEKVLQRHLVKLELGVHPTLRSWSVRNLLDRKNWDARTNIYVALIIASLGALVFGIVRPDQPQTSVCIAVDRDTVVAFDTFPEIVVGDELRVVQCPS